MFKNEETDTDNDPKVYNSCGGSCEELVVAH
jgi:hypothetical protein